MGAPGVEPLLDDPRLHFIADAGAVAFAVVDPRHKRLIAASLAFADLLGYGADALEGLPIEAFADAFPGVLDGRVTFISTADGRLSWETRWRRRDGAPVDVVVHTLEEERGDHSALIVVAHDRLGERHESLTWNLARTAREVAGTGVLWLDEAGGIVYANRAACLLLDARRDDLLERDLAALTPDFEPDRWRLAWADITQRGRHLTYEAEYRRGDGGFIPVEVSAHPVELDGACYVCAFFVDVSDRRRAQQELAKAEERYALAARGANDGLWDWELGAARVHYSSRWSAIIGFQDHELSPALSTWLDRIHPEDRARVDTELNVHLAGDTPHFQSEHRVQHKNGTYRWVLVRGLAIRDEQGTPVRMAGSASDITHRKTAEARLQFEAFHDALTGLANRALLIRRLQQALEQAREERSRDHFAILFVDVDDFKLINDSLGHTMGDMLLRAVASRLERCVRSVDTVSRLGGDEFCLLLRHVSDVSEALRVSDRVQEEIGVPFNLRGYEVFTSASVGVALNRPSYDEAEEMLRDANIAMFQAKEAGRGKRAVFDASMHKAAVRRLTMETDLRRALERNEFEVYYQPIVSLQTGLIKGFEALVRWHHPKRGLVMPTDFIRLAEDTGLIIGLGRWVLSSACQDAIRWSELGLGRLSVSVNVSARQLVLPYLVDQVSDVLGDTGLDPDRLNLEITESVLMDNAEAVIAQLHKLRELGVGLHIDDFGTGYSSLAYLHRFPIDTLKIDRSFISNPTQDDEPWAIVETIHTLAKLLGMKVTAEGVEAPEHVDKLRALGCDSVQGYFISRPICASGVMGLIGKGRRW